MTGADPATPGILYDARRGVYYTRPALRGWLHLLCFWASLAGGALLLTRTHGAAQTTAVAIYSASLSALFGTSALYHRGTWTSAWRLRLRHLDQAMIFFLIAGTATPAFLLSAPAGVGLACLIGMWAVTLTAVAVRLAGAGTPELVAGALFIGLGCLGGLALPWVWIHGGTASGVLILTGGVLYITGALFYHHRWPDPYPSVFGYHEAFHVYVCAAAACQYAAIARLAGLVRECQGRPPDSTAVAQARRRGRRLPPWPHPLPGPPPLRRTRAVHLRPRTAVGSGEDHADDRRQGRRSVQPGGQPAPLLGGHPD